VATVKAHAKKRRRAAKKVVATTGVDIGQIRAAFGLLKMCGSAGAAKAALNAAEDIRKMV